MSESSMDLTELLLGIESEVEIFGGTRVHKSVVSEAEFVLLRT